MVRKLQISLLHERKRFQWFIGTALSLVLLLCVNGTAFSQGAIQVSGKVTDQTTGDALPGVNIVVKGTTQGTSSDMNGEYQLNVPSPSDTLMFSYIGYTTKAVPVNGQSEINVTLASTQISAGELVVVGYSSQKKQDVTGSVSVVNVEDMNKQPAENITKQLQGQASGVTITSSGQPGEAPNIKIRGSNTFGNNNPLYVVDGVPTSNINDLNPNDIASMQVLKDAAAASIYGSRASNGVIIITTKEGHGDVKVTYDAYYGYQVPPSGNVWNKANSNEMMQITWNATKNSGGDLSALSQYYDPNNPGTPRLPDYIDPAGTMSGDPAVNPDNYYIDPNYTDPAALNSFYYITRANKQGTNWFDAIFDPAATMSHNLSVSGGGDLGNYLFSFNFLNNDGPLMQQYLKRYTLRANTNFDVSDDIRIGENLSYSISDNPQVGNFQEGGPLGMAMRAQPIIPVYDIMGNFAGTHASGLGNGNNPVAIQYRTRNNEGRGNRLFGNLFAEVDLLNDLLTVKTTFGGELTSSAYHNFGYPTYEVAENSSVNQYSEGSTEGYNYTWSNTLTYKQTFNDAHNVTVVLGTEAYKNKGSGVGGTTQDYFSFNPDYTNLDTGAGNQTNYSYHYEDELFSLLGRFDYSYKDRYLLSGTLRRDGSSKFLNYKYGWFPAGSIGWRISNESFFPDIDWVTDLKLRAGYGIMGNQLNVDPNNPYTLYTNNPVSSYYAINASNSNNQLGFQQGRIGNPDAKWEKDANSNFGIDATLFDGRLNVTADYYVKKIKDLLYNPELPGTAGGAAQPYINVGDMKNEGLDASVSTFGNITGDLQYNATVTFTTYKNTIQKIAEGVNYFEQESRRFNGSAIIRNAVGHPISSFYGYNIAGFWNSQSEIDNADSGAPSGTYQDGAGVGRFRYQDVNGDGEITPDDRTFLGDPNPDFTYGINFGLNYKNFDFSMFIYGSQGNDIWNQVKWWTDFYSGFRSGKSKTALYDSWTPDNHNATAPILETEQTFSNNQVPNSYFVENGSYLRLKNIQLGYTIPQEKLQYFGVQSLRVYVQAANLFTITNYSGPDPEVGYYPGGGGGGSTAFGIDESSYPTMQQFLVGVNLSF